MFSSLTFSFCDDHQILGGSRCGDSWWSWCWRGGCVRITEGVSLGRTTPMRSEPNHIRHWHHSQPKTLRQWVYGPWSLYGALLSQYWSMCFAIFFFFILRIQKIMLNFYLFNIEKLKKKWKKTIITMELFFRTSCCEISIYRINKIWE